jgi:hypothetical protein
MLLDFLNWSVFEALVLANPHKNFAALPASTARQRAALCDNYIRHAYRLVCRRFESIIAAGDGFNE